MGFGLVLQETPIEDKKVEEGKKEEDPPKKEE